MPRIFSLGNQSAMPQTGLNIELGLLRFLCKGERFAIWANCNSYSFLLTRFSSVQHVVLTGLVDFFLQPLHCSKPFL